MKKDKSPFRSSSEARTGDTAGEMKISRRDSIDGDSDVADYHAIVNGLAEPCESSVSAIITVSTTETLLPTRGCNNVKKDHLEALEGWYISWPCITAITAG